MVWTLVDAIANERDPLRKGVLQVFWLESNAMAALPWETVNRLRIQVTRLTRTGLTKAGWVPLATAYAEATPVFESINEEMMKLGRDIDTPREYADLDGQFEDLRALGVEAALKAFTYEFNLAFVQGPNVNADGSANANAIIGVYQRITDLAGGVGLGDAKVNVGSASAGAVGAAGGTNFGPTATAANANSVLDAMNRSIYFVDGHRPDWAFCNQQMLLALESQFRRNALFSETRDQYERFVYTFRGIPIYDVGLQLDQTTNVILNTEISSDGTGTATTSMIWGKNGIDTHFGGIEMKPLDIRDLGEIQTVPNFRTRVDWVIGLANWHTRALSRTADIKATT